MYLLRRAVVWTHAPQAATTTVRSGVHTMSARRADLRRQYQHDVTAALVDYVDSGGRLSFISERDDPDHPLVMTFEVRDALLFDRLLHLRMTRSSPASRCVAFIRERCFSRPR